VKNTLLAILILGLSFEASAFFNRKKESVEVRIQARAQYLGDMRGFSHFHLDNIKVLEVPSGIDKESLQKGLNAWVGARSDERLKYRACDSQADIYLKIDKRDLAADGQVEYETLADIELMRCR
jgi:predicted component of type VI protein secretion system